MADKIVKTRIKNRFASLNDWSTANQALLAGEIAVVSVTTTTTDDNGNIVQVPAYLIKVGGATYPAGHAKAGQLMTFNDLPWLSATAADVYDWAKGANAEDVDIAIKVGAEATNTSKTLGTWIKNLQDTNDSQASALSQLTGKVDVAKVSTAIKSAIDALGSTSSGEGTIVKAVTQTNGNVAVTMGKLTAAEIPDLAASKITAGNTTLDKMLENINSKLASVNTDVLGDLNVADNEAEADDTDEETGVSFVSQVTQSGGKIAVKKRAIKLADLPTITETKIGDDAVTTNKIKDGAVTADKIGAKAVTNEKIESVSTDKVTIGSNTTGNSLTVKLSAMTSDISGLKNAVAGGVHFIGISSTAISNGSTTSSNLTIDDKLYTDPIKKGDVVIYGDKEYIWSDKWVELGDQGRIATLETKVNNLDYTDPDYVAGKVVTKVTQNDGQIAVEHDTLTSAQVKHGTNSTVSAAIGDAAGKISALEGKVDVEKVSTAISNALDALDFSDPSVPTTGDDTTATEFIDSISQENGQITATKKSLPEASTTDAGIVKLNSTTSSTSTTEAATASAVKSAYDKAEGADQKAAAVQGNYIRCEQTGNTTSGHLLAVEGNTTYTIIFDCGGASV
jgi:hypothetical protein